MGIWGKEPPTIPFDASSQRLEKGEREDFREQLCKADNESGTMQALGFFFVSK